MIIQFGAILSVVVLYWKRFFKLNKCKIFDTDIVNNNDRSARWIEYGKRFCINMIFIGSF